MLLCLSNSVGSNKLTLKENRPGREQMIQCSVEQALIDELNALSYVSVGRRKKPSVWCSLFATAC